MKLSIPLADDITWDVEAEIIGDLAIHQRRNVSDMYTVTHVPTLMTMREVTPRSLDKKKDKLIAWARRVQEGLPKDWLALRKYTRRDIEERPDETAKLRERIRNHCLGVKA